MFGFYVISAAFLVAGALSIAYSIYAIRQEKSTERVRKLLAKQPLRRKAASDTLESKIITGSIFNRTILPAVDRLLKRAGRFTPQNTIKQSSQLLTVAGSPMNLQPTTYYGLRLTLLVIGALLALLSVRGTGLTDWRLVVQAILTVLFFYYLPGIWLRSIAQRRRRAIRDELPDALDLLYVLSSAGFNFNQAMARINEQWDTLLGREFGRVISEVEIGVSLEVAMKNFSTRVDVKEVSSFVAVIIQSSRLGIKSSDVLRAQANQMRVVRQFRAKEAAQKMPAKMMVPMAILILPALLYIVLVPAFLNIIQSF